MSTPVARHPDFAHGAPTWRALGVLAAVVLAAHALVLRTAPSQFGPALAPPLQRPRVFLTRSLVPPPPAEVTAPVPETAARVMPIAKPADKPVPKKNLKGKVASAQQEPVQSATDFIARADPEPIAANAPDAPASLSSAPAVITDRLDHVPVAADSTMAAASAATVASAANAGRAASAASAALVPPIGSSLPLPAAMALPPSTRLEYKMTGRAKGLSRLRRTPSWPGSTTAAEPPAPPVAPARYRSPRSRCGRFAAPRRPPRRA